jgi:hypothetical protein
MRVVRKWRKLGWRHPLWGLVRYYNVAAEQEQRRRDDDWLPFVQGLRPDESTKLLALPPPPELHRLFVDYGEARQTNLLQVYERLRFPDQAMRFYQKLKLPILQAASRDVRLGIMWTPMLATVNSITRAVCSGRGVRFDPDPQPWRDWFARQDLPVTARHLDGAIAPPNRPPVVWEVKEFWKVGTDASRIGEAVYECDRVGRELREFEERTGLHIAHVVFLDGNLHWIRRLSAVRRLIDLFHQGMIDYLFVGRDIEKSWQVTLTALMR